METTLDRFGRIVIPKEVRDDMGLEAGAVLQIEKEGEKIVLNPVQGEPQVMEKKGILVFTGKAVGDVEATLHEHRKRRMKKMARGL
jgi:AbrB family looped-hinge helix DNA binding protein